MKIIEFSLSNEIKKQLGFIIREIRKMKFNKIRYSSLIENNPYTKENFCENNKICHYHTLTKLENDVIKEDYVYHVLLEKLGCYYQVGNEEHKKNMNYINNLIQKVLKAGEYIDDELAKKLKDDMEHVNFKKDIIADYHLKLLSIFIRLQLVIKIEEELVDFLNRFCLFFQGIFLGVAFQCLGIYHLNKIETDKAKDYFFKAKEIYDQVHISKGLISSYLIAAYVYTDDYYHSVPLCNEMESFYKKTNNYKRLMHVYNYLANYYLLINAYDVAKDYFDKAIQIINNDESLERYKFSIYYNWAFRCFKKYSFKEALDNFKISYECCNVNYNKLQILNLMLIMMTKLQYPKEDIMEYYHEGEKYFKYSNVFNQNIFKYFRFKLKNSKYYRKFAYEKIIPLLADDDSKNEILLFFYQDLFKL